MPPVEVKATVPCDTPLTTEVVSMLPFGSESFKRILATTGTFIGILYESSCAFGASFTVPFTSGRI